MKVILYLTAGVVLFSSCSKTKTYTCKCVDLNNNSRELQTIEFDEKEKGVAADKCATQQLKWMKIHSGAQCEIR